MNMDAVASVLCGVVACCCFLLFIVSSPGRKRWLNFPLYFRLGLVSTGALFLIRSVNFTQLSPEAVGHINWEGMAALACLSYMAASATFFAVSSHFPNGVALDRVLWFARREKEDPSLVAVLLEPHETTAAARHMGMKALGPGATVHDLIKATEEAGR